MMVLRIYVIWLGFVISLLIGCRDEIEYHGNDAVYQVDYPSLFLPPQPNILWIVAEDLSPVLPDWGDTTIRTPHISRLVKDGVKYTNFFSPSGVCAPSRSAIATGMYPTRTATNHMRTGPWWGNQIGEAQVKAYTDNMPEGLHAYEGIPPEGTHMHAHLLRKAGYYCSNNSKEDYQFRCELTAWDDSSPKAHYRNRAPRQPFFAVFNIGVTHESRIWTKAGDSLWVSEDLHVPIPPYLPDTDIARQDIRRMYSNIVEMDHKVGEILDGLEASGELENTIIFWYTDHGGPLPRQKRVLYDSGLRVPMVVRFPDRQLAGKIDTQLLSFIDLKPTILSLAGIEPAEHLDGKAWMGDYLNNDQREYIHAAGDRFDNLTDRIRAVRDHRYKYIRNYMLDRPVYLDVEYRKNQAIMQELLRLKTEGNLTLEQSLWFRPTKQREELYDTYDDPHEMNNLVNDPDYEDKLLQLRKEMDRWLAHTKDTGLIPEKELIKSLWPDGQQPVTSKPKLEIVNDKIKILLTGEEASIGYQWLKDEDNISTGWQIYREPIEKISGSKLIVRAHRIGYLPSELVEMQL